MKQAEITVTGLNIYPVKSCAGIALQKLEFDERGPLWDRHWMVVNHEGRFQTQRELPAMALIKTALSKNDLQLSIEGHGSVTVPFKAKDLLERDVEVWRVQCTALDNGEEVATFLSDFLKTPVRLVHMPENFKRMVNPTYGVKARVQFADAFPILVIGEETLELLNSKLLTQDSTQAPMAMDRFRPNIVVRGAEPHAEEKWMHLKMGGAKFKGSRPCYRCIITTVHQQTAKVGKEPLKTLASYRRQNGKILFGQNLIHMGIAPVGVGDRVEILEVSP